MSALSPHDLELQTLVGVAHYGDSALNFRLRVRPC